MLQQILDYWKHSWEESKVLFWCEAIATIASVIASFAFAFLSPTPPLIFVFSGYLVGSVLLMYTMWVRKMIWLFSLMAWYTGMNILGLWNAL